METSRFARGAGSYHGYLHEGHASLIEKSVSLCDRTVASVFVNPTQFGPGEDLETYPRDFSHGCELLKSRGCDMVFHPDAAEMYPPILPHGWKSSPICRSNFAEKRVPFIFAVFAQW